MLRCQLLVYFLVLYAFSAFACSEEHAVLGQRAFYYLSQEKYDSAYFCANHLLTSAANENDSHCVAKSQICLWYASSMMGNLDEAQGHLEQAQVASRVAGDDLSRICNTFETLRSLDNSEEKIKIIKHEKNLQLASVSAFSLLIIVGLIFLLFRQKSQIQDTVLPAIDKPSSLRDETQTSQVVRTSSCVCSDQKRQELVSALERLMADDHLYREKLLTRERVADLLGTNRTYLGQVMSEVYQKSFTQYINDLRIDEAVSILDNPLSKRPIRLIGQDLGFNSVTTFNSQFQNRTGMTPAQYRQKVVSSLQDSDKKVSDT